MIINLEAFPWQRFKLLSSDDTQWSNMRAANVANLEVMNEKKSPTPAGAIPSRSNGTSLWLYEKVNILGEFSIYEPRLLLVVNLALKGVGIKNPWHNMWLTGGMPSHCLIVCWWVSFFLLGAFVFWLLQLSIYKIWQICNNVFMLIKLLDMQKVINLGMIKDRYCWGHWDSTK